MRQFTGLNSIFSGLKLFNKEQIFRFLSGRVAEHTGADPNRIMRQLLDAEGKLPSGIGEGVAIPHLKLKGIKAPYSMFARLSQSVDFGAADGVPVDMVFLLVSPEEEGPVHLSRLARVSRFFRDRNVLNNLREADNDNAILEIMQKPDNASAA